MSVNNLPVGIIGCGTMGKCMIDSLVKHNYDVIVYDKFESAVNSALELGATKAVSPFEVATKANIIIMSLPGPIQINEVVFGKDGLNEALSDKHIVVDTSTVDPKTTKEISDKLSAKNTAYLDCPILGRPSATGKWLLPAGGDEKALKQVSPVLNTFASTIVHTGQSGNGNALKLLNQMMFGCINAISSEVMAICEHIGIDKKVFYETVASSSAATVSGLFKEVGKTIISDDYHHPSFTVDLMIKDMKLALEMAKEADAPSSIAGNVQMFNELAHAQGLGSQDTSALFKMFEKNYTKE